MKTLVVLLIACACACAAPFLEPGELNESVLDSRVPPWPETFQGRTLRQIPLSERERGFLSGFPGSVARFTDGERDIVLRWVLQPTRQLHPAEDCYRGSGYQIRESRIMEDRERATWRCFSATRSEGTREVCENIRDAERRWTDVSSWYWAATLKRSEGPWLVTTIAQDHLSSR
jgi:hypothetical protein